MTTRKLAAAAIVAGSLIPAASAATAQADALQAGHYCSKYDGVGIRTEPVGTARDNLAMNQTFQVQRSGDEWVYGYKIVNGVHGYVRASSLYSC